MEKVGMVTRPLETRPGQRLTSGRKLHQTMQVSIQGSVIEIVDTFKFLGVHLNNTPDWTDNTDGGFCNPLQMHAVTHDVMCWRGGSMERDRKGLNK